MIEDSVQGFNYNVLTCHYMRCVKRDEFWVHDCRLDLPECESRTPLDEEIPCLHLSQCKYVKVRFFNCPEKIGVTSPKFRNHVPKILVFRHRPPYKCHQSPRPVRVRT